MVEQPKVGDVVFVSAEGKESAASQIIQKFVDPDARKSRRCFSHVAVVIDSLLALEAVPAPDSSPSFELPGAVELSAWTKSELRGGVRLIPIADLIIPQLEKGTLAVVRAAIPPCETFSLSHPVVLALMGSSYSIENLKTSALAWFPRTIADALSNKVNWTSRASDLAALADLSPELRENIAARFPNYALPAATRTYFCSQLVITCLELAGMLSPDKTTELTTPTGLYQLLESNDWTDVTKLYASADREAYLGMQRSSIRGSYYSRLALSDIAIRGQALGYATEFAKETLDAMSRLCAEIDARLKKKH